jgi:1-acyl-sn-glycerol-3-phosphate acyltransferase
MSSPPPSASSPPPDPIHPNWVWRTFRAILRNVFAFWMRLRARGFERLPDGGALFLINHQSFLDPLLVGVCLRRPVSYLARDNLFRVPFIGWVLRNTYVMPIRREAATTDSLRESIRRIEHGFYVGIFPEGTRTHDGAIGELKPGFVALLRRTNVPLVPIGIAGANEVMPRGAIWLRPRRVHIVFGEPVPAEIVRSLAAKGREAELVQFARDRLEECRQAAEEWRMESVGRSPVRQPENTMQDSWKCETGR